MICFDLLGGAKYPDVIARIPGRFGIGVFWKEFGPAKGLIQREAKIRPLIRVQGIWDKSHQYSGKDTEAIDIGKQLNAIARASPKCRIEYSPFCEHEKKADYIQALFARIKAVAPLIILVNTPDGKGDYVSGYKNELHLGGSRPKPHGHYNVSYDGLHSVDADIEGFKAQFADADAIFYWVAQFNLHSHSSDPLRNCPPSLELINSIIFTAENPKQKVKLADGYLYKSHSQQDGPNDSQGNKPVVLQPAGARKANKVELFDGSKLVASFNYGGLTDDSDPRKRRHAWKYYNAYGYRLGRILNLKVDGKSVGAVDGGWRQNEYRNHAT
jgi:hypothetical protein